MDMARQPGDFFPNNHHHQLSQCMALWKTRSAKYEAKPKYKTMHPIKEMKINTVMSFEFPSCKEGSN